MFYFCISIAFNSNDFIKKPSLYAFKQTRSCDINLSPVTPINCIQFLLKYRARERLEDQNINDKCQNWEWWCGKRKCHTTTITSRSNLSLRHLSHPLSVLSKEGRSFTSPIDITEDIILSTVTPIICIQLPVEVLGKRKIGRPEHTWQTSQLGVEGGKRKCHTTTIASRINLSLRHLSLPLSVVSKKR